MGRKVGRLSALEVKHKAEPGYFPDGAGLYLQVSSSGSKSWVFRFQLNGRRREMGLGATHTVLLTKAREKAREARELLLDGIDPIEAQRAKKAANAAAEAASVTFDEAAEKFIAAKQAGWKNEKHAAQWKATLTLYASPVIGKLSVQAVELSHVMKILEPIWNDKPVTAQRVRGRIESVLDWCRVRGFRKGDNPARWRGHLDKLLAKPTDIRPVQHFTALPYKELPAFWQALREEKGNGALALQFAILTAARSGEVRGAIWAEIDEAEATWTIPASRMKAKREHKIPLSAEALAVLQAVRDSNPRMASESDDERFVFPSAKRGAPLSDMTLSAVLRRMERGDLTVHGFRSTFRDWASEQTSFPPHVAEQALAHTIQNKAEAAYRRGDLFEKRRRLMAAWASFATTPPEAKGENIVSIGGQR